MWRPLAAAPADGGPWGRWRLVPGATPDRAARLERALLRTGADVVVGPRAAGPADGAVVFADTWAAALGALREAAGPDPPLRLWLVTHDADRCPVGAGIRALACVAGLELPRLQIATADVGTDDDLPALVPLLHGDEDVVAVRGGRPSVRRLEALASAGSVSRIVGALLVTGGAGGVGSAVAAHLGARGADRIVLLQRSAPDGEVIARLTATGADVVACRGDVRRPDDVARAVALAGPRLRAIVHAAGVTHDGPLEDLEAASVEDAVATKAGGLEHLLDATANRELDLVAACSSLSGIVGFPGQGAYAAGNAALDAVVADARRRRIPAVSVAWGAWDAVGGAHARGAGRRLRRLGLPPLAPDEALRGFDDTIAAGLAHAAVVDADWRRLVDLLWLGTPPPLLRELVPVAGARPLGGP